MVASKSHASMWAQIPHGADVAVQGFGSSAAEAFSNAACAMTAIVVPLEEIAASEKLRISCAAPDLDILLLDWLNALIFEMATRRMLFREFEVEIIGSELRAEVVGEAVDVERHAPAIELKGATLTLLKVTRDDNGQWMAQCVVDV